MNRAERRRQAREQRKKRKNLTKESASVSGISGTGRPGQETGAARYLRVIISRAWKLLILVSVIAGLPITYFSLRPDVSVEPYRVLDPNNPFSEQFRIENNGSLAIYKVSAACTFRHLEVLPGPVVFANVGESQVQIADRILSKESATTNCRSEIYGISKADIGIDIGFKFPWFPWRKQIRRRFVGVRDYVGRVQWNPQPIPD